jgi:hypothetical protein
MHSLIDMMLKLEREPRNRQLVARIVLNAHGFAERFPVDISELRDLSADQRAVVRSYLTWVAETPEWLREPRRWGDMFAWAQGFPASTALQSPRPRSSVGLNPIRKDGSADVGRVEKLDPGDANVIAVEQPHQVSHLSQ